MRPLRSCDFCDDEAVGIFEVVPPELTDGEQRRVVLCADCRGRLQTLLEPLIAHIDHDRRDAESATPSAGRERARASGGSTDRAQGGSTSADRSAATDDRSDGVTVSDRSNEARGSDAPERSNEARGNEVSERSSGAEDDASGRDRSHTYVKVVQLLNNRGLPLKRREAESFAVEAYDLDRETVSTIIDHALEKGVFREKRGKLREP